MSLTGEIPEYMNPDQELSFPKFIKLQFVDTDEQVFRWIMREAVRRSMGKSELVQDIVFKRYSNAVNGRSADETKPTEGVTQSGAFGALPDRAGDAPTAGGQPAINTLKNRLQDTISRHNREVESLKSQIRQLTKDKENLRSRLSESGLGSLGDIAATVDAKVSAQIEKYEIQRKVENLQQQVADKEALLKKSEKEIADLTAENESLEDQAAELTKKLADLDDTEKKLERYSAPVLYGISRVYPGLKPKLEGLISGVVGQTGLGEAPLTEDDRQGLEFVKDLRHKFSGEEQDKISQLLSLFHQNKQLLNHSLRVAQTILEQPQPAPDPQSAGSHDD